MKTRTLHFLLLSLALINLVQSSETSELKERSSTKGLSPLNNALSLNMPSDEKLYEF